MSAVDSKTCVKCQLTKPLADFYSVKRGKLGRDSRCKACWKPYYHERWAKNKEQLRPKLTAWKKNNPEKIKAIQLRRYGLTPTTFYALLAAQNDCCAICVKPFDSSKHGRPHIDHDHVTGHVRGIIHGTCNLILGFAKDDATILLQAARYLKGATCST